MFEWLLPAKCVVDDESRDWIHQRMQWLTEQFGADAAAAARAIEPTDEFFPDPFNRDYASAVAILQRVCAFMNVDPARFELKLYTEDRNRRIGGYHIESKEAGSAGRYVARDKEIIAIETSSLIDPMSLIATIAHELAHARLLGEKRLSGDEPDHERLTDLATVFFGLGIFNANSAFRYSQWARHGWHGWEASRQGYLSEQIFGYALALWTITRGDPRPRWTRHLRLTPRSYMKTSIRYLQRQSPKPG